MRWTAKKYNPWKRRLLLVPMRFGNQWAWLEMVWMFNAGTHTEVLTDDEYSKRIADVGE